MPPERSEQLVYELEAWYRSHSVRQKDLAGSLGMSAQQLAEILSMRNRPTGEQALRILEFLNAENMKPQLADPPAMPRASTRDPNEPRTLLEAKNQLENLRLEVARLKAAAVASPAKPALTVPTPTAKPAIATPTASRPNSVPMPASPPPPKLVLSADLDSPVKIQTALDGMNLADLRLALDSTKDQLQVALLIREIRKRRELVNL
jgi:transcriptional regulator with XRE-family HTH domain